MLQSCYRAGGEETARQRKTFKEKNVAEGDKLNYATTRTAKVMQEWKAKRQFFHQGFVLVRMADQQNFLRLSSRAYSNFWLLDFKVKGAKEKASI